MSPNTSTKCIGQNYAVILPSEGDTSTPLEVRPAEDPVQRELWSGLVGI